MSDFFNVEVELLSSYRYEKEQYKDEVASLRQKFVQSIAPGVLAGDRRGVVPASGFSSNAQDIWKHIKENKDLDLPSHTIMVATLRCENVVSENYSSFVKNKDWLELREDVNSHLVPGFGKKLSSLLDNCLSNYDEVVRYYDANVVSANRKQLEDKLMQHVQPAYKLMFEHIRSEALDNFKRAFNSALKEGHGFAAAARDVTNKSMGRFEELCEDATSKQVNWDSAEIRGEFSDDMVTHISKVRDARLPELTKVYESNIKKALSCNHVEAQLEVGNDDTWPAIIFHLRDITETVVSKFSFALSSLDVDQQEKDDKILKLKSYARRQVEKKAKTKAGQVLGLMKDRFEVQFNHDDNSMPRRWTDNDNISARTKTARTSCLKLLSVLAAIRLDEYKTDTIWETLVHSLVEGRTDTTTSHDPLASNTWEKIPAADTLITPVQCKSFWDEFQRQTEHIIKNARDSQKAYIIKKKLANLAVKIPLVALRVVLGVAALATGDPVSAVEAVSEIPGLISDMSN